MSTWKTVAGFSVGVQNTLLKIGRFGSKMHFKLCLCSVGGLFDKLSCKQSCLTRLSKVEARNIRNGNFKSWTTFFVTVIYSFIPRWVWEMGSPSLSPPPPPPPSPSSHLPLPLLSPSLSPLLSSLLSLLFETLKPRYIIYFLEHYLI